MATILPSALNREPHTNLNLNVNTGPLMNNGRIPFLGVKSFLSKLHNKKIKFTQNEGYIDIADILTNPPVCNKLLYVVPSTDCDLAKSCMLCCFDVSMSQMVKENIKLFNIYQKAFVKPATSKILNVIRKPFVNIVIVHEFNHTNVHTTLSISGEANRRLRELTKNTFELSPLTGIDEKSLNKTKLEKLAQKHLNDIDQYLATQLAYSQISLNEGVLFKSIQIAKGLCIPRPLARVIHRYFESLWNSNINSDETKQECLTKILQNMAEQTNAAIFELEHNPSTFLTDFIHEYLDSRIISESITKNSSLTIDHKVVGGILVVPPTSSSILNMYIKPNLKEGFLEGVKYIYFKPDDIFDQQTDKDRVEILYRDGINLKRAETSDVKTENLLTGNEREKTQAIVKLTKAGKQLLSSAKDIPNNLMGQKSEFAIAEIHFKKPVQYYEHLGKVYPIELLPSHAPGNSDTQWTMNTEMNHIGVVLWGAFNKRSKSIESYALALENELLKSNKNLQNPHSLFSTKSIHVKKSGLDVTNPVFGPYEALNVLTNPTRFSCTQVLEAINITTDRVSQLFTEQTHFIQSYFNEINDTCLNHRKLYNAFMKSLTIDGICLDKYAYNKLMRIEFKQFFSLYRNSDHNPNGKYTMLFRHLSGSIPWFVCGDEVNAIRGNNLLAAIQNTNHWHSIICKIKQARDYITDNSKFVLQSSDFCDSVKANRCSLAGFGKCNIQNTIMNADMLKEWYYEDNRMVIDKWLMEETGLPDTSALNQYLKDIANGLMDAFSALFQTGCEHELNYLFIKSNIGYTQWLFIVHVILPVLTNGKMKLYSIGEGENIKYSVKVNTNFESLSDDMILCSDNDDFKTYVLSANVARMAAVNKYAMVHRMASITMMFMYNTPYCIEQLVSKGVHTGFSIAFIKNEKTLAEDIMLLQPDSMELIMGNGDIENSEMTSDGSTTVSMTCEMKYTQSTLGPIGLLAQCVYPKPSTNDRSRDEDGFVKISSDFITRVYTDKYHAIADLSFAFNSKNKDIIQRYMNDIIDSNAVPYLAKRYVKTDYVPIISPPIDLNDKKFHILGLERCADFLHSGGKAAFHSFFYCQNPCQSKNPYMSNLFSEGPVRYMKDTLIIDKNVPIKTSCLPKDVLNTSLTTQVIEDMYNMMSDEALSLTPHEYATFANFEDQVTLKESITSIPCILMPDNRCYSYDHPDHRLGNALPYTQYTAEDCFVQRITQSRAYPGGDIKLDGSPFGFMIRSPFTANRDINPKMVDTNNIIQ